MKSVFLTLTANSNHNHLVGHQLIVNGPYTLTNIKSGKILDVPKGSIVNGTKMQQWDYYHLNSQRSFL